MRYSERKIRNGKVCAGLFAAAFSVLFSVSFIGMRPMLCTVFLSAAVPGCDEFGRAGQWCSALLLLPGIPAIGRKSRFMGNRVRIVRE